LWLTGFEAAVSVGKICGADAYTGVIANTRVGADIRLICAQAQ
jgi:hypothetical protein